MSSRGPGSGFTLLEMLVVLALFALAAGIVAPQAGRWLEAAQARGWRADLRARLEAQPIRAFLAGQAISLDAQQLRAELPGAPQGLRLALKRPLRYSASGAAEGGELELIEGGRRERWLIRPVSGEVQELLR
ncbi:type II secretion system protein [Pelomonas sp. SE-A7]|uniref:type II secretion system protein n=1 Tax=Pelomonas sp. SE-A7 TaxID=3054953 RepID=UPI00259CEB0F|nr:type II secretion system protein [Pelomonas sp. SE-A7]MDM4767546.1 type II secretion system protein [Pelomonas sp. SE-A7]